MNVAAEDKMTGSRQRESLGVVNTWVRLFIAFQVQLLKSICAFSHGIVHKYLTHKFVRRDIVLFLLRNHTVRFRHAADQGQHAPSEQRSNHRVWIYRAAGQRHLLVRATVFIEYSMIPVLIEYFFPTGFGSKRFASKG